MQFTPCIFWFRNDLRINDNAALEAAFQSGAPVLAVYIWDPDSFKSWVPGGASKVWLHHALKSLSEQLEKCGGRLLIRIGTTRSVLEDLISETGAEKVYWNRRYEPHLRELDASLKQLFRSRGFTVKTFNSALLNEPHTVENKSGTPFKVYTPYFKCVHARPVVPPVAVQTDQVLWHATNLESVELDSLELLPEDDWWQSMISHWDVSEAGAHAALDTFLKSAVKTYDTDRNFPAVKGSSTLSPYLQIGLIGPRQVVAALKSQTDLSKEGPHVYLKEIYWREFAYNVLFHFPHTPQEPLQAKYADFPWEKNDVFLKRWQTGQTGYPIIDAGMRQLYATGWMHNRVRMIVASLLVKHLLQDWKEGAAWFWDTLVDADLASNTLGWQWSGGCGADAAPYFRVFNPITQGEKFDPDGGYVRQYVPELAGLPNKYLHAPWEAPAEVLTEAGVELGKNYPETVVEHTAGRARALAAFELFKTPISA